MLLSEEIIQFDIEEEDEIEYPDLLSSLVSFRGSLISSKPIDLKIGLNVR